MSANVHACKIDTDLLKTISAANSLEKINIIITVCGGISAKELCDILDSTTNTLDDRRRKGVNLLLDIAEKTQAPVMEILRRWESQGIATNIESRWLTNSISADLLPEKIIQVAKHSDVKRIFQCPEVSQIEPDDYYPNATLSKRTGGGVEENLKYIGADSAWRMGYTGEGRVVCHFDGSGVEGIHPALYSNWKGHDGDSAAAWRSDDPEDRFPHASWYHGTHVVGIMVGHDDNTGDTIGVAPGAKWIAYDGLPYFEWAANPDGDPNTTDDIPDVINFSMDFGMHCGSFWDDEIDMTEALGTVNVFCAGNRGPGPMTMASPASRADDSLTNFAVGSIDYRTGNVWWSSSRGPSSCDSISIKPNVTAPGAGIRSATPGGGYDLHGGTSMAVPHVAGAVAILRQYNPNATTREIKEALLAGCIPRGSVSPNNSYGWGVINIPASLEYLAGNTEYDIRIDKFVYDTIDVEDTLKALIRIRNRGKQLDSIYARVPVDNGDVHILTDSIHFGSLNTNDDAIGDRELMALINDTIIPGQMVPINLTFCGAGGHKNPSRVHVRAGHVGEQEFFTHNNGIIQFTISNFGQYGFADHSFSELGYAGFRYKDTLRNDLYEASMMIGIDAGRVSDGFRIHWHRTDDDFWHDASDHLEVNLPGQYAEQETYSVYSDACAENPIGIKIGQRTYSWNSCPDNKYVIIEYEITNLKNRIVDGIYVGLVCEWSNGLGYGDFARNEYLGFFFHLSDVYDSTQFRGLAVLNEEGVCSYRIIGVKDWPTEGIPDTLLFNALSEGMVDTNLVPGIYERWLHTIATGPFSLMPGESDTAIFAFLGADSLCEMKQTALRARQKILKVIEESKLPEKFMLRQNYPNPFNSVTIIEYDLPQPSQVDLNIYNILGQKVSTLVNENQPPGYHRVLWDAADINGRGLASGLYFYRLKTNDFTETRKMLLLK